MPSRRGQTFPHLNILPPSGKRSLAIRAVSTLTSCCLLFPSPPLSSPARAPPHKHPQKNKRKKQWTNAPARSCAVPDGRRSQYMFYNRIGKAGSSTVNGYLDAEVRSLRRHLWTISRAFSAPIHPILTECRVPLLTMVIGG